MPLHTDKNHVAEAALVKLAREKEEERAGLLAPKPLREAAQNPITEHLNDYVADLKAQGCSRKHVALAKNRPFRLCSQCGWTMLGDISSDAFNRWRAGRRSRPKRSTNTSR